MRNSAPLDESVRQLRSELEEAQTRRAELESRLLELEKERDRLEQEKEIEAQKAKEVSYIRLYEKPL
ncbi:hypothetical protein RR46_00070 [Papilio xuthus]|uniref:Uncharacterized protein n=1 Tax=Papilio xuthus TaxID=66420 RepID=A0A0N1PJQ1_PAPXU|nr:hypothetical protein RR46_00070 [Papilio xuthus]